MSATRELRVPLCRFCPVTVSGGMESHAAVHPNHRLRRCFASPDRHADQELLAQWSSSVGERWFCCHECARRGDYSRMIPMSMVFGARDGGKHEDVHKRPPVNVQRKQLASLRAGVLGPISPDVVSTPMTIARPQLPMTEAEGFPMKKKAVVIGISYFGTANKLDGCSNDVTCMTRMLIHHWGFRRENIQVLSEAYPTGNPEIDADDIPTKGNILKAMKWLVAGSQFGDSLLFHFSGHGVHRSDKDGDELDGLDDALVPMDFRKKGVILDDKVNEIMVHSLPEGVRLHMFWDVPHSGTMADLPWIWDGSTDLDETHWKHDKTPAWQSSKGSRGTAISLSCCDIPLERNSDRVNTNYKRKQGALTHCLLQLVDLGSKYPATKIMSTYFEFVTSLRAMLRATLTGDQIEAQYNIHEFARRLHEVRYEYIVNSVPIRVPQLSCSTRIDMHQPFTLSYSHDHHRPASTNLISNDQLGTYKRQHRQTLQLILANRIGSQEGEDTTSKQADDVPSPQM